MRPLLHPCLVNGDPALYIETLFEAEFPAKRALIFRRNPCRRAGTKRGHMKSFHNLCESISSGCN